MAIYEAVLGAPATDLAFIILAVFLGAAVKGAVGFGMPIAALPLLTFVVDLPTAVALLAVPILTTNIQQAIGSRWMSLLLRFWPLVALMVLGTALGVHALTTLRTQQLNLIIGITIVLVAAFLLLGPRVRIPASHEKLWGPFVGFFSGLLGGMAALFGPPLVVYLVGLDLRKDEFVRAVATIYLFAALTLLLFLGAVGPMRLADYQVSALATVPAHAGIWFGGFLRRFVPPDTFRIVVLMVVIACGLELLRKGLH